MSGSRVKHTLNLVDYGLDRAIKEVENFVPYFTISLFGYTFLVYRVPSYAAHYSGQKRILRSLMHLKRMITQWRNGETPTNPETTN